MQGRLNSINRLGRAAAGGSLRVEDQCVVCLVAVLVESTRFALLVVNLGIVLDFTFDV